MPACQDVERRCCADGMIDKELPLVCMVSNTSCLKPITAFLLQLLEVQQTYCYKFLLSSDVHGFAGTACSPEF